MNIKFVSSVKIPVFHVNKHSLEKAQGMEADQSNHMSITKYLPFFLYVN